ncbi:hypothetical protein D3C72_1596460 [compost metagenome]
MGLLAPWSFLPPYFPGEPHDLHEITAGSRRRYRCPERTSPDLAHLRHPRGGASQRRSGACERPGDRHPGRRRAGQGQGRRRLAREPEDESGRGHRQESRSASRAEDPGLLHVCRVPGNGAVATGRGCQTQSADRLASGPVSAGNDDQPGRLAENGFRSARRADPEPPEFRPGARHHPQARRPAHRRRLQEPQRARGRHRRRHGAQRQ